MKLVTYDRLYIDSLLRKREKEIKLGELVQTLPWGTNENFAELLAENTCKYVLIGLPEDVGVRANGGRGGTYSAWLPVLNTLMNTQSNHFLKGDELLVLGHIDFTDVMNAAKNLDFHNKEDVIKARNLVHNIDEAVMPVIRQIVTSGKEAIIVGGGHNNAYPCIKGAAYGLLNSGKIFNPSINVINCDAHSDFRPLEGRHSGNAFSYAYNENLLNKYSMLALHESYNTKLVLDEIENYKARIHYTTFEEIFIRQSLSFEDAIKQSVAFTLDNYTGLEIDLDAIQNIPSSAKTSSGINTIEARRFIYKAATSCKIPYFHIAEAAPVLSHIKTDLKTGKLVSYLITDYIKARNSFHN
jgi:formiminoglutamase